MRVTKELIRTIVDDMLIDVIRVVKEDHLVTHARNSGWLRFTDPDEILVMVSGVNCSWAKYNTIGEEKIGVIAIEDLDWCERMLRYVIAHELGHLYVFPNEEEASRTRSVRGDSLQYNTTPVELAANHVAKKVAGVTVQEYIAWLRANK